MYHVNSKLVLFRKCIGIVLGLLRKWFEFMLEPFWELIRNLFGNWFVNCLNYGWIFFGAYSDTNCKCFGFISELCWNLFGTVFELFLCSWLKLVCNDLGTFPDGLRNCFGFFPGRVQDVFAQDFSELFRNLIRSFVRGPYSFQNCSVHAQYIFGTWSELVQELCQMTTQASAEIPQLHTGIHLGPGFPIFRI